jgi:cytochrome P450
MARTFARLEAGVAITEFLRRHPEPALLEPRLTWRSDGIIRGLANLPVRLGPGQPDQPEPMSSGHT